MRVKKKHKKKQQKTIGKKCSTVKKNLQWNQGDHPDKNNKYKDCKWMVRERDMKKETTT